MRIFREDISFTLLKFATKFSTINVHTNNKLNGMMFCINYYPFFYVFIWAFVDYNVKQRKCKKQNLLEIKLEKFKRFLFCFILSKQTISKQTKIRLNELPMHARLSQMHENLKFTKNLSPSRFAHINFSILSTDKVFFLFSTQLYAHFNILLINR